MGIKQKFTRSYSCEQALVHLQGYLDGEVDPKIARKVAKHLADCPLCENELKIYEQIKVSLRSPQVTVDPEVVDALTQFGRRVAHGELT